MVRNDSLYSIRQEISTFTVRPINHPMNCHAQRHAPTPRMNTSYHLLRKCENLKVELCTVEITVVDVACFAVRMGLGNGYKVDGAFEYSVP